MISLTQSNVVLVAWKSSYGDDPSANLKNWEIFSLRSVRSGRTQQRWTVLKVVSLSLALKQTFGPLFRRVYCPRKLHNPFLNSPSAFCVHFSWNSPVRCAHFWHPTLLPLLFIYLSSFLLEATLSSTPCFNYRTLLSLFNLLAHWSASPLEPRLTAVICAAPLGSRLRNEAREEPGKKEVLLNNTC